MRSSASENAACYNADKQGGQGMANIREIAKLANVSVSTVSRVLNKHPYVAEEKRLAVMQAIEKLDYIQNINAVHLSRGKTRTVGVMLPYVNHPYFSSLLEGIGEEALKQDYGLHLFQTAYDPDKEIEALAKMKMRMVDGMIILSRKSSWSKMEEYCLSMPAVICEKLDHPAVSAVYIDHYKAFRQGLDHLLSKGYRRIGYCIARRTGTNSMLRYQAFSEGLAEQSIAVTEDWIFDRCLGIEDGERVARQLYGMAERPDALLVSSDQVAAGIIAEWSKLGLRIPGDLAVLSFDNHPISRALQITTMDLPVNEMGKTAFRLFLEKLTSGQVKQMEAEAALIERKTV
ncbi:LacI family transcriptional regulator [Bacillus sp. UMB0728]|nr:LacI family transcriptional regulator [Bacillus sp. UMB0728]